MEKAATTVLVKHTANLGVLSLNYAVDSRTCKSVNLLPGVNEVDAAEWAKVVANPIVKYKLESGDLEVIDMVKGANPLAGMPDPRAVKLVQETVVLELLEKWLAKEKRAKVVAALKKQIEELNKPIGKPSDEDDE